MPDSNMSQPDAALGNDPTATPAAQPSTTPVQVYPTPNGQPPQPGLALQQPAPPQVGRVVPAPDQRPTWVGPTSRAMSDPNQSADPRAVQKGSAIHDTAWAMAGSPVQYQTDANGVTTATRAPVSTKQLMLAIAAHAISGGLTGASAVGPGSTARGGAAAFSDAQKQVQDQNTDAKDQSVKDAQLQQTTAANNLKLMAYAQSIGKQDEEANQNSVKADSQAYSDAKDAGAIVADNVSAADAKDLKKYPLGTYDRLAVGYHPRVDAQGNEVYTDPSGRVVPQDSPGARPAFDRTYAIVDRHSVSLTDDQGKNLPYVQKAIDRGDIISNGNANIGSTVRIDSTKALALQRKQAMTDAFENDVNARREENGLPPMNLDGAIKENHSLENSFSAFTGQLNANGHNYTQAWQALAKTDPSAAGQIASFYGGTGTFQKFDAKSDQTDRETEIRLGKKPMTKELTDSIRANPDAYSPDIVKMAETAHKNGFNDAVSLAGAKSGAEARAKKAVEGSGGSGGQAANNVQTMGEAIANGNGGTLDDITDRKTRAAVSAYLSQHHPNLDQKSVTLKGDEAKRRDTAENAMHNLDIIQNQLQKDPTLLGKLQGRITQGRVYFGTDDPHLSSIDEALDNYVNLTVGAHSMRSVEARKDALKALFNNFHNSSEATISAMNTARQSLSKTADLGKPKGVNGSDYVVIPKPQSQGQVIDGTTVQKYVKKYGNAQAARTAAQQDGWALPTAQGSK